MVNKAIMGTLKKILQIILYTLIIWCVIKIIRAYDKRELASELRRKFYGPEFNNRIISKFVDSTHRGDLIIILDNKQVISFRNGDIFTKIQVNDLLIKPKNSMRHLLIHNGDSLYFYPLSYDEEVK